jgi:hypothetical protein
MIKLELLADYLGHQNHGLIRCEKVERQEGEGEQRLKSIHRFKIG